MHIPKMEVINLFKFMLKRFNHSQIVLEVANEKYTRGLWKKIVKRKIKRLLALNAVSSYDFGIKNASELESYTDGLKVIDEWSFVEDPDVRPRIYKYLEVSRVQ